MSRFSWLAVVLLFVLPALSAASEKGAGSAAPGKATAAGDARDSGLPEFDDDNQMLLPRGYREWVFVGSSVGLGYKESSGTGGGSFSHVYINPHGYREYQKSGTFPVGTVLMLEAVSRGEKSHPALSGAFSDRFKGLEAAVKTGDRFDDVWTYYDFWGDDQQPTAKASRIRSSSCIDCHREHAATDHVFTQFYPVLRATRGEH